MRKGSLVVAVGFLVACSTRPSPAPAVPASEATASTAVTSAEPAADSAPVALASLSDLKIGPFAAEAAHPEQSLCTEASGARGFYGFYRTDAWEKGNTVLTFDDGPHPTATPRVLDLLAKHELPATFFVVGRAISRDTYPLIQRIVAEGHTLGSHSYSHDVKMTRVGAPADSVETIVGQHAVTAILIDISLMAKSGDDFDAMFSQVFERDPAQWLTPGAIKSEYRTFSARHDELLAERGYEDGEHPYTVLYSRPPGGGPYVEHDGAAGIAIYDSALRELKMMNVMWHGASGDTVPEKRSDYGFLTDNLAKYSKSGGVLLIHDYIRSDALAKGLERMVQDDAVKIVPIDDAVRAKYRCDGNTLTAKLHGAAPGSVLAGGSIGPLPAGFGG
ncbi:MAG: polysaccharide deacetylase family protein [Polyangiaceae bacterium]|nr:polysaccharide deacetylase family protein [Polyangiaceae bacterium]